MPNPWEIEYEDPLSVRNNNPGNMKSPKTGKFSMYQSPEEGMAAMQNDLLLKISGQSRAMGGKPPTIRNVITTWAPPSDNNDTNAYINFVSSQTGQDPDAILTPDHVPALSNAITQFEGGPSASGYFSQKPQEQMPWEAEYAPLEQEYKQAPEKTIEESSTKKAPRDSLGRTVFEKSLQGATAGFSDEITAPLGAVLSAAISDPKSLLTGEVSDPYLSEQIATAPQQAKEQLKRMSEDRPVISGVSEIGGAIGSAIPMGLTKTGAAVANWASRGGTAARMGKAYMAALPGTAAYVAGTSEGDIKQRAGEAVSNAPVYALAAPAAVGAGQVIKSAVSGMKNIKTGVLARSADQLSEAADKIKQSSALAYSKMRQSGAVFNDQFKNDIVGNISQTLKSDGPLNQGLHGGTMSLVDDISKAVKEQDFGLEQLDQWRRLLGQVARLKTPERLEDARKASIVIDAIDDAVSKIAQKDLVSGTPEAVDALNLARKEYQRFRKFESISDLIENASGDAYKLKRDLEKFRLNPKKTSGWSKDELLALEFAAKQTTGEGIIKQIGKFGLDLGSARGIGNTALPALGGYGVAVAGSGIAPAAVVPAVGTVARYAQKALARGKAEDLLKVIENGGKITTKMVNSLPKAEQSKFMRFISKLPASQANVILQNNPQKVK